MKKALRVKNYTTECLPGKSALVIAAILLLAVAPIVASADNLYKCMGDEGEIYYQDIKCGQAQEAVAVLNASGRSGQAKFGPHKEGEAIMLSSPRSGIELPVGSVRHNQDLSKS